MKKAIMENMKISRKREELFFGSSLNGVCSLAAKTTGEFSGFMQTVYSSTLLDTIGISKFWYF